MISREGYRKRIIDDRVEQALKASGAVCIKGPRWCGKTWTSMMHANSVFDVGLSTDRFRNRRIAEMDPELALQGEQPHLVDEWQDVPAIWDATRSFVDRNPMKGQIILAGSSVPPEEGTRHSGEGRILDVCMHTMSLFETGDSDGKASLRGIIDGTACNSPCGHHGLEDLAYLAFRGGWPALQGADETSIKTVLEDYIGKAVASASKMDGVVRDSDKMAMLFRSLARNESTTAAKSSLSRDVSDAEGGSISDNTMTEYLGCLSRMYLREDLPAFDPNIRSSVRVGKAVKRHLADPSLAVAALGMDPGSLMGDLDTFGSVFESLCEHDLRIYAEADGWSLRHYRDAKGREVDAVVECRDGYGLFEVKLGSNQIDAAAENLKRMSRVFEDSGKKAPKALCVICGLVDFAYRRDDGVFVAPITSLKP